MQHGTKVKPRWRRKKPCGQEETRRQGKSGEENGNAAKNLSGGTTRSFKRLRPCGPQIYWSAIAGPNGEGRGLGVIGQRLGKEYGTALGEGINKGPSKIGTRRRKG